MKKDKFAKLMVSANQALEHAQGKRELRTTVLPRPVQQMTREEIVALRQKLHHSQAVFAAHLNVSVKTVQAWEQGIGKPSGPALKLLTIVKKNPKMLEVA